MHNINIITARVNKSNEKIENVENKQRVIRHK